MLISNVSAYSTLAGSRGHDNEMTSAVGNSSAESHRREWRRLQIT